MKVSLQTKLLLMCTALILMTAIGISSTYYILTKEDKHQESRRQIQVAFDVVLDSFQELQNTYSSRISGFLSTNAKIASIGSMYGQGQKFLANPHLINAYITSTSTAMRNFSRMSNLDTLALYALDKRLLLVYQQSHQQEIIGGYVLSETGQDTFLDLDEPTNQEMMRIWMGETPIPDASLPDGIAASYAGDIPESISSELFSDGRKLGIRVSAPVIYLEQVVGVLVSEIVFTQSFVERYASLNKTAINFFAESQQSVGTLSSQTQLEAGALARLTRCEALRNDGQEDLQILPVMFEEQEYFQGACALDNARGTIGAMTVSLSQETEKQAMRKIALSMVVVSGMTIGIAVGASLLFSRKAVRFIQKLLTHIDRLSTGDIPEEFTGRYKGEFHEIQQRLNLMGRQLKDVIVTTKTLSDSVAASSESLTLRAENMSQGASQQAAASEEASASMEQMAANIRQNADNAAQTEKIALQSAEYAEEGANVVTETVSMMEQIAGKIAIIEDIAGQTRLLSLNATIEAARAQEHGKAFSVVASEVRQLSEVTRKAAEGINELAASSSGVSEKAGEMLRTLVPSIHNTAELVREISAANNEQSTGSAQINQAIQQLDQITQQNAAISHEISTTAEELATQAQHLRRTIEFFNIEDAENAQP